MSIISYTCWLMMLHPAVYLQASNQVESSFRFGPDSKYKYETISGRNHKLKHHLRFYPNYSYYTVVPSTVVLPIHISAEVKRNALDNTRKLSINRELSRELRTTTVAYKHTIKKAKINISDGIKWEYLDDQVTPQLIKSSKERKLFLREYDHHGLDYSQMEQDIKLDEVRGEYSYLPYTTYKRKRKWNKRPPIPRPNKPSSTLSMEADKIFDDGAGWMEHNQREEYLEYNSVPYEPTTTEERKKRKRRPYTFSTTSKHKTDTEEILHINSVEYEPTTTEKNKISSYTSSTTSKRKTDTEEISDNNGVQYEPTTTEEKKKRKKKKKYRHHKHTHNHHYHEKKHHKKNWWQNFVSSFWNGKK